MRLVLSRASPEDFDQITALCFRCFEGQDLPAAWFGYGGPASRAFAKKAMLGGTMTDPADVFLKIEDQDAEVDVDVLDEAGNVLRTERKTRIVGCSDWRIYPTYVPPREDEVAKKMDTKEMTYLDTDQQRSDALVIVEDVMTRRKEFHTEPHVLCYLLFTDPEYQRKGIGKAMMQWGNDLADTLMVACWIESSAFGEKLYESCGYVGRERVKLQTKSFVSSAYWHMRRPPQVSKGKLEGGAVGYVK